MSLRIELGLSRQDMSRQPPSHPPSPGFEYLIVHIKSLSGNSNGRASQIADLIIYFFSVDETCIIESSHSLYFEY